MSTRFFWGLSPWVVFAIMDRGGGQGVFWAAALAALTTFAVIWRSPDHPPTALNWSALVFFGGFAVTCAAVGADSFGLYGRTCAAGGLTAIAVVSLLTTPLVEQYTRDHVSPDHLESQRLWATNYDITRIWAMSFACITASFLLAAELDTSLSATAFNWAAPSALVLGAARLASNRWEQDFEPDDIPGSADVWRW